MFFPLSRFAIRSLTVALAGLIVVQSDVVGAVALAQGESRTAAPKSKSPATNSTAPGGSIEVAAASPVIPGFERLQKDPARKPGVDDEDDDAPKPDPKAIQREAGYLLLGELNCTSCHAASNELKAVIYAKQAPVLDAVGARVSVEFLRTFLADPHSHKPSTTMPALFATTANGGPANGKPLDAAERAKAVEPLVHFLAATGALRQTSPDGTAAKRGDDTYHKVGCVACHGSRRDGAKPFATAVPLGNVTNKYSIASLTDFLRDPLKARPSGRMPHLNLEEKDARDLANFLLKGIQVEPNLNYAYYEGNFPTVPDFAALKPKSTGTVSGFDLGIAPRKGDFGMRFEGFLQIAKEGEYRFHLGSDDGSRLTIDGKQVVLNDGVHPFGWKDATAKLTAGPHPIVVEFTQGGGEWELALEYEGAGLSRQPVAGAVTMTKDPPAPAANTTAAFSFDPELAKQGKALFVSTGCVKCHQMKDVPKPDGKAGGGLFEPPPLAQAKPGQGCVAESVRPGLPQYRLTAAQRDALNVVLMIRQHAPLEPKQVITRTLAAFNCQACHERDNLGGPALAIDPLFQGTIQEMGDEGRIPPHLNGIGDKLQTGYLNHLLNNGVKDRTYMVTRMPRFGGQNVGHLTAAFEKADLKTESKEELPDEPLLRVKLTGRILVGEKGLSCVKCHSFAPHKATGIQAVDLTTMTGRLREDWFLRYMINPQRYRPGTRMPTAFPNGISIQPKIYDGKPNVQLSALWQYLTDGPRAAVPAGIVPEAIELIPETEPIVYRNFLQGLSPRGIAVGFPEKAHYAWDADGFHLGLIWQNQFLDASKHWVGRGPGNQTPLGDNIFPLSKGAPFARLDSAEAVWPNQPPKEIGYAFKGYRLDEKRRPIFRYMFNPNATSDGTRSTIDPVVTVEDAIVPAAANPPAGLADPSLSRTLTLTAETTVANLSHRVLAADSIEPQPDGAFLVNKHLRLTVKANGSTPTLRKAGNQTELLVPVRFENNRAEITLKYVW